ncbi:stretch-activated Ca2+-permeable channel component-domain-containing protein [Limtongia smithiae]|uniref:stretch-activated Ca2+-permeable channel component-domain-containing protein n=1 Tax=Limtongia smithiae TaxID=1125753 RepID=UPI0034CFE36D
MATLVRLLAVLLFTLLGLLFTTSGSEHTVLVAAAADEAAFVYDDFIGEEIVLHAPVWDSPVATEVMGNGDIESRATTTGVTEFSIDVYSNGSILATYSASDDEDILIFGAVCWQPDIIAGVSVSDVDIIADLQLSLSVGSTRDTADETVGFVDGVVNITGQFSKTLFIHVIAPTLDTSKYSGSWRVELYVLNLGKVESYTPYTNSTGAYVLDTDNSSALFLSEPISSTNATAYKFYVYAADDTSLVGLSKSHCAVKNGAHVATSSNAVEKNTDKMWGNGTRQTTFFSTLNSSTTYLAYIISENVNDLLTLHESPISVTTKSSSTCRIVYNLGTCSEVAYAAPSNSSFTSTTKLSSWYDSIAKQYYKNFQLSMMTFPCYLTDKRYTILRTCDDCEAAYKRWLCLTLIPRCYEEDVQGSAVSYRGINDGGYENTAVDGAKLRTVNSSRNDMYLNSKLQPDEYTELLPCSYECHNVMQSCPSTLGFQCPIPGKGLYEAYGRLDANISTNGAVLPLLGKDNVTCNFLGTVNKFSAGAHIRVPMIALSVASMAAAAILF